jgi:hypothetical protein
LIVDNNNKFNNKKLASSTNNDGNKRNKIADINNVIYTAVIYLNVNMFVLFGKNVYTENVFTT